MRPNKQQIEVIENWLNLLRRQYNYRLGERFNWYEQNRSSINSCPLICHLPQLKNNPEYYSQKKDLINTKKLFFEYKMIHSQVLQDVIKRVKLTFDRWLKGDSSGKRSGKPRFKGMGRYHSFTYPQMKPDCINGKRIKLPKIGEVKFIQHRPIPDGFKIKTATVIRKADGYYVILSLEDKSIPSPDIRIIPNPDNTIGIDMGLKAFLIDSLGVEVKIPQYYRQAQKQLRVKQKAVSRKKKGTNNRKKAIKKLAKRHQKVANIRKDFHYKTATNLLKKNDVIAHEKLNIKGLAKTRLSKSVNDAAWGQFLTILASKAEKAHRPRRGFLGVRTEQEAGLLTVAVKPHGTTQECSCCGKTVKKRMRPSSNSLRAGTRTKPALSDRWHSCSHCGFEADRDQNAAINIKNRAVGHPVRKVHRVSEAIAGVGEKPTLYTPVSV